MLPKNLYDEYLAMLKEELVPATGCTEPIAVAYAAAKAREVLGQMPERLEVGCSANIIKNVKGVTVPNTGGLRGIRAAATAGVVGGVADARLEVLQSLTQDHIEKTKALLAQGFCSTWLVEGVEGVYIEVRAFAGSASSRVIIEKTHTGIAYIEKDGQVLLDTRDLNTSKSKQYTEQHDASLGTPSLKVSSILEFADTVRMEDVAGIIRRQIELNSAIADEGLKHDYGMAVGKSLLRGEENDVRVRARARAAAGSDARMGGCAMPVVINSGSGNQGLTVSVPVIEYAKELGASEEKLIRALVLSNLVSLEQKSYIGKLSAYCGAVSAAVGSAAGIAYLEGGTYEQIAASITNTIVTADGIVCDGAKASCAAKIATALEAAILGQEMGMKDGGKSFSSGDGLVGKDVDDTIRNVGIVGAQGMRQTDVEIINLMLKE
ncbi:MAG TPA: L-serine ammonia-lyase, iron-sulfur-dependent, subunit alpha [Spirochaetales bacterium]|nr:L-serine ammonia-lyase, iron-sulfur-dependent, subunit alpha [Spirochaetales bacterium]HPS15399.1 L-serine ammonia-lyase, iron-sulfur-dependent, subunit alpha [Spirochaetales bacterium]